MGGSPEGRRRPRRGGRSPVVLLYHGFTDAPRSDDPENLFVTGDDFAAQLDHLLDAGWEPLDLSGYLEALERRTWRRRSFLVTIDDGLGSVGAIAAPILEARGVPAVLFVPAGLAGATAEWLPEPADEPIMGAAELRELAATTRIEIGGHGCRHIQMVDLTDEQLRRETVEVKELLTSMVGRPVRAFAYPFGDHDEAAVRAVEAAGYDVGFSVHHDVDRFAISRVDVNAKDNARTFRLKLIPFYRVWWRTLEHAPFVRRTANRLLSHRRDRARSPLG
jgi:peptidoglycan/xylan/chitin deacetylase (PgdA/CDA1 family)